MGSLSYEGRMFLGCNKWDAVAANLNGEGWFRAGRYVTDADAGTAADANSSMQALVSEMVTSMSSYAE